MWNGWPRPWPEPSPAADMTSREPMRIATGLHSPQLGGSQIATIDLASRLRRRGHQVEMFVIDQEFKTSALPLAEKAGFDVEILPAESNLADQAAQIRSFVERHDAQVAHVYHEHHWLGALVALALRPMAGRSAVVTNWMMENHRWIPPYAPLIVGFESIRDEAQRLQRGPVWLIEPPVDLDLDRSTRSRARRSVPSTASPTTISSPSWQPGSTAT